MKKQRHVVLVFLTRSFEYLLGSYRKAYIFFVIFTDYDTNTDGCPNFIMEKYQHVQKEKKRSARKH